MIVLCTHHKGGVGKTELAIHVAGILQFDFQRTLLIDCDSQASAWKFYFNEAPTQENEPRAVDQLLSVVYNPKRLRIGRLVEEGDFDHCILDIDTPLEHTVQSILQQNPDLILIPVNLQAEAILNLPDPLAVISQLEATVSKTQSRCGSCPSGPNSPTSPGKSRRSSRGFRT